MSQIMLEDCFRMSEDYEKGRKYYMEQIKSDEIKDIGLMAKCKIVMWRVNLYKGDKKTNNITEK